MICCIASVICSVFFIFYKDALEDNLPLGYEGDSLAVLASIKAADEGGVRPFAPIKIARLNAPEEAWWSDVPISELVFWLPSILCPWLGLIQASSCFVCIALSLAGLAFYCSAVLIGVHPLPSATLAILYGLLPYAFVRNLEHVMLTLYFVVPLFIPFGSNTPKLASALIRVKMGNGESIYTQKTQCFCADVSLGVWCKV